MPTMCMRMERNKEKKNLKKQLEDSIIKKERNLFKAKKENTVD